MRQRAEPSHAAQKWIGKIESGNKDGQAPLPTNPYPQHETSQISTEGVCRDGERNVAMAWLKPETRLGEARLGEGFHSVKSVYSWG